MLNFICNHLFVTLHATNLFYYKRVSMESFMLRIRTMEPGTFSTVMMKSRFSLQYVDSV